MTLPSLQASRARLVSVGKSTGVIDRMIAGARERPWHYERFAADYERWTRRMVLNYHLMLVANQDDEQIRRVL